MENKFWDKLLDEVIEEAAPLYFEKEGNDMKLEEIEEVKFSDIHNKKMKNIFKTAKRDENRANVVKFAKKVAVVIIACVLITGGLITTVEAWRKEVIRFIMKNNDDNYMSINFGDTTLLNSGDDETYIESEDNSTTYENDGIKFLYVPDGFEVDIKRKYDYLKYYSFTNEDESIYFLQHNLLNINKRADIEDTVNEKIIVEDKEIFKVIKDERINYVWYDEYYLYSVLSNLPEKEILKFIENIKILKNF